MGLHAFCFANYECWRVGLEHLEKMEGGLGTLQNNIIHFQIHL